MYIIKNALRSIGRSKARNILIGIIVLVIAVSACIGLSIRQAAEKARKETLETLSITATISFDRRSAMGNMEKPSDNGEQNPQTAEPPEFDRSQFAQMMGSSSALSLEEYKVYSKAQTVKDFYYTISVSVNGDDNLTPVTSEEETETASGNSNQFGAMGGKGGKMNRVMGAESDFTVTGYSNENAMTSFSNGTASVTDGTVFTEGTENYECLISEELATFNSLSVGDSINITNPNNEQEAYTLKVVGIYNDTTANQNSFSMMGMTSNDPANKIYMSYTALANIVELSAESSTTATDENTGREFETKLSGNIEATYSFASIEDYEQFTEDVYNMGLDESYTVSSNDLTNFENSLTPLTTLSKTAGYFLLVILIIGGIILIVLNIFNVRERKYEIGVLTAMGMKKSKVALQFITEIFAVTLIAVIIGAGIGAVSSVPVTNALLENQISSAQNRVLETEKNFGRGEIPQMPDNQGDGKGGFSGGGFAQMFKPESINNYITEINSATDFTVILQMLGIAILLTLIGGMASVLFIMRYEPLKILANRD